MRLDEPVTPILSGISMDEAKIGCQWAVFEMVVQHWLMKQGVAETIPIKVYFLYLEFIRI